MSTTRSFLTAVSLVAAAASLAACAGSRYSVAETPLETRPLSGSTMPSGGSQDAAMRPMPSGMTSGETMGKSPLTGGGAMPQSGMGSMGAAAARQPMAAAPVMVPSGHVVAMETTGTGEIVYECREKSGSAGSFEWAFVGPTASLADRQGRVVGRYFGPPATWAASDGSSITGTQLAVAPAGDGNLPHQLVKAAPATGAGAMSGISYVQRVATRGGVAPTRTCQADTRGQRETVRYQADYVFWKPA